jgi:membrane associated rhomboid family serine protease
MLPIRDRLRPGRVPIVNYLLIAANIAVFIWERWIISMGVPPDRLLTVYGLVPRQLVQAPFEHAISIFTSMFMHDPTGWAHIGGNMLYLWIFGDNVEDAMGHGRYAAFYLLSGVAAAAAQILIDPSSSVPVVGASGAIAGVLAAYGSLYPRSPITVLNPVFILWFFYGIFLELPAWVVILLFFVVNLWNGLASLGAHTGGVAFFAHVGGFVAGLFLVRLLLVRRDRQQYDPWKGFRPPRPPRSRAPEPPNSYGPRPPRRGPWDW